MPSQRIDLHHLGLGWDGPAGQCMTNHRESDLRLLLPFCQVTIADCHFADVTEFHGLFTFAGEIDGLFNAVLIGVKGGVNFFHHFLVFNQHLFDGSYCIHKRAYFSCRIARLLRMDSQKADGAVDTKVFDVRHDIRRPGPEP